MHPFLVRNIVYPLQELVKGKPTYRRLRELDKTQWLPRHAVLELQFKQLRGLLAFAAHEVPYYRQLFDRHNFDPKRIGSMKDFSRLPTLDKDTVRARFDDLHPSKLPSSIRKMSTGGSTGKPVTVLVDSERAAFTDAARLRAHRWYEADMGEREIALWGSPIELGAQDYIRNLRDRMINSRLLSAFDLGEATMAVYGDFIARFRPRKMYGYASAFYWLAKYLQKTAWKSPPELKVIFATAEPLFDFQRELIEKVFGCRVAVEYGARDAGLMANECPDGGLHIPAEGMIVEIDSPGIGRPGEIIVTNLFSWSMPIIRYRTGDIGELDPAPCSCGRGLPCLKRVEGRQTDFLVTPSGKVIHALAVIYVIREMPAVKEFQVIQQDRKHVSVRIVPESFFGSADEQHLLRKLLLVLGPEIRVTVETIGEIPRLPSGKYRYVVSHAAAAIETPNAI